MPAIQNALTSEAMAHRLRISGHCICGQLIGHEPRTFAQHLARMQRERLEEEGLVRPYGE